MQYYVPVVVAVLANILYNITAKNTPQEINPFGSLVFMYTIAALCSLGFYMLTSESPNLLSELPKLNWTTIGMAVSIVGIEAGYLYMYRVGWPISSASIVVNIILAMALIFIGVFFYKDHVSLYKIFGIGLCIIGLLFINKN